MGTNSREVKAWALAVAAQVRAERGGAHMTQEEVYTKAGMARSTYLRIEAGTRVTDVEDLAKIVRVFGIDIPSFMARAESRVDMNQLNAKRKPDSKT